MKAKPFKKAFVKHINGKIGVIKDFLREDKDNEMGTELGWEWDWYHDLKNAIKNKSLLLSSDTLAGIKEEVENFLKSDYSPEDFWYEFEEEQLKQVVSAWEKIIPSEWGNKEYRVEDCGMIYDDYGDKDMLQFVTYISPDVTDAFYDEETETEFNYDRDEVAEALAKRYKEMFDIDFNVSMEWTGCYGDDIEVSIPYDTLLNTPFNVLERLENTEDLTQTVWEELGDCMTPVTEEA